MKYKDDALDGTNVFAEDGTLLGYVHKGELNANSNTAKYADELKAMGFSDGKVRAKPVVEETE